MAIIPLVSETSVSTEGLLWCFAYASSPALSLRRAIIRRACQVPIKPTPKKMKARRMTVAVISLPFQWKALLAGELVGVADAEAEVAVVDVMEAVAVDAELEGVEDADREVVVVATTPLRPFMNGSSARTETTHSAIRNCSRESDGIFRACQAVEVLDRAGRSRCKSRKEWRWYWGQEASNVGVLRSPACYVKGRCL